MASQWQPGPLVPKTITSPARSRRPPARTVGSRSETRALVELESRPFGGFSVASIYVNLHGIQTCLQPGLLIYIVKETSSRDSRASWLRVDHVLVDEPHQADLTFKHLKVPMMRAPGVPTALGEWSDTSPPYWSLHSPVQKHPKATIVDRDLPMIYP